MTTTQAIATGLRATRRVPWLVLIFFACNLLLAGTVAAPMYTAIADHVGNGSVSQKLAEGFSSSWLMEFQIAQAPFLKSFSIAVAYAGILFLVLNTALSAGAFEVYGQGEGAGMHAFGRGIGKYFGRFARVAVTASLLYFAAFWFWQGPVATLVDRLFENTVPARGHFYLTWLRWALLLATLFVINVTVEYAKANIVIDEHLSALAALGHAAGFVVAHFRRVMAIYIGMGMLTVVAIFGYAAFARYFPQSSVLTVLIWFVAAQALLWLRWMFRLSSWGAAVAYYSAQEPQALASTIAKAEVSV